MVATKATGGKRKKKKEAVENKKKDLTIWGPRLPGTDGVRSKGKNGKKKVAQQKKETRSRKPVLPWAIKTEIVPRQGGERMRGKDAN